MKHFRTVLLILTVLTAGFLFFHRSVPQEKVASAGAGSGLLDDSRAEPTKLIRGGEVADVLWTGRTPAAKRARKIFPDPAWMTPEPILKVGDRITMALFDNAVFEAEISNVTRYPNGAVGMTAQIPGGQGTVYLSYFNGELAASVEVSDGTAFSIERRDGFYYAVEIDRANSDVLEGAEPQMPSVKDAGADVPAPPVALPFNAVPGAPAGSSIIDVMIVYTPAAKSWAATNSGIENVIAGAMQRANTAHTNSDTQVYLNLVHSEEVSYTEQGIYADLNNLTFTGSTNSTLDTVQTLRDQYKADLVCLLEKTDDAGGLGWLLTRTNGSSSHAFCVVRVQQSRSTYTVVHEWGHNMGCGHYKEQTSEPGPTSWQNWSANKWSAGWRWTGTNGVRYCSVMTYESGAYFADGVTNIRVAYFSNPSISYKGVPTGDAVNGDNARTIRSMKSVLANYRKAPDIDYDGIPNEWELQYFGGETNANPNASASNGINTVLETYIAGLNPTNRTSFFRVSTAQPPAAGPGGFVIGWSAVSGRVYSINWTTNLQNSFQPLETNIVWPQTTYTDTVHDAESSSFYKINVRLAP
ncbi:MAG: hypothetical protein IT583_03190 [Verrucomicrobia bacterium]|nr:hypothetical protein [Verrucomicrobiota bacterium]